MHGLTIECAHTHKKFRELPNKHGRTSRASSLMHDFISMLPRTHTQTKDMVLIDFRPSLAGFCRERRRSLTMAASCFSSSKLSRQSRFLSFSRDCRLPEQSRELRVCSLLVAVVMMLTNCSSCGALCTMKCEMRARARALSFSCFCCAFQ
jgi:hypothetical protein